MYRPKSNTLTSQLSNAIFYMFHVDSWPQVVSLYKSFLKSASLQVTLFYFV